jgi:restriction system protein
MAVPDFQTLMRPLLELTDVNDAQAIGDLRDSLADRFQLSDQDRAERIPSGRVTTFQNRVGWAATYLYRCGLLERPERAHYRITERGRTTLKEHPDRVDLNVLRQFDEFDELRNRGKKGGEAAPATQVSAGTETPEERMDEAYEELRAELAAELLDRVRDHSWQFFEDLVLHVLRAMGYGGPKGSTERLGRSGDEGVDGVIREDALGLDLIYVQAKKWANNVQRPDIQRFYGALHGQRATRGVFITTSAFSPQAKEYAEGVTPRVILVNGRQLAELMLDHGVGVTVEHAYEVKRIDLDYFVRDDDPPSSTESAAEAKPVREEASEQ